MPRLLLAAPFLMVLHAAAQAPEDSRPPLFFREDWKEIAAVAPVTQEHVANPALLLGLYGPGKDGVRKSHHDTPKDDPYYIWLGSCPSNCAIAPPQQRRVRGPDRTREGPLADQTDRLPQLAPHAQARERHVAGE